MFCHDAYPKIPAGHDAPGSDPVFAGDLPKASIASDATAGRRSMCMWRRQPAPSRKTSAASIVNPARLRRRCRWMCACNAISSHQRQPALSVPPVRSRSIFVCARRTARRFLLVFDHAPGAGHDDKFEIVNARLPAAQVACFLKSNGAMTCTTCHDPHTTPANYSDACRKCHAVHGMSRPVSIPLRRSARSCHMPKRQTDDVVNAR